MIADEHTAQPTERVERHFDVATLTLIETALEDVGLTGTQSRRQVVVRGVRLNELADRRGMGATLHLFPAPEPLQAGFGDELPRRASGPTQCASKRAGRHPNKGGQDPLSTP